MSKLFTSTFAFCLIFILGLSTTTQAQDKISLGDHNGIELSYTVQFLGSIDKKKADKSRDEYQITVWTVNNTGKELYCTSSSTGGARVANSKSTRKTVRAGAVNSLLETVNGQALFVFRQGATLQGTGKVKVQKGVKPVVTYDAACNFLTLDNYNIRATAGLVNGSWKVENGTTAMQLTFINGENETIQQQAPDGKIIVWYKVGPKTFQRTLSGSSANLNDATVDANQTYSAKITFIGMDRIQYTNTEGISINWIKQ